MDLHADRPHELEFFPGKRLAQTPVQLRIIRLHSESRVNNGSGDVDADPESGVSFAYLTNSRVPDPWHSERMDRVSNFIHSAID